MTLTVRSACWFVLPWLVGFLGLTLLPMGCSVALSALDVAAHDEQTRWERVGWQNYRRAISIDDTYEVAPTDPWRWRVLGGRPNDERFHKSVSNSLYVTVFGVPLGLGVSLAMALFLNAFGNRTANQRLEAFVRACVYLPHFFGCVAALVIWSWLLNPQFGWVNQVIRTGYAAIDPIVRLVSAGGTQDWPVPAWLYSPQRCKPAVILIHIWTIGASTLVFLAALRRVPVSQLEAARLDGAVRWRRFLHVTWPHITPAVLFNLIASIALTMQSFNDSYVLENRSQDDGLLFFVRYLYETAFQGQCDLGYAAALSWIFVLILIMLTVPILLSSKRWVRYEA